MTSAARPSPHIIITYPYPLGQANGGSRMTREIARHLGRAGARVTIISVAAPARLSYPRRDEDAKVAGAEFDDGLRKDGVRVVRVSPNLFHWSLDGLEVRKAVRRLLREGPVDLVLSYYHEGAFLPSLLRLRKIRFGYIATWISYQLALNRPAKKSFLREFMRTWIDRRLVIGPHRKADVIFATSAFTRGELIGTMNIAPDRIRVCPLGVASSFLEIPREPRNTISRILFFARLVHIKGIEDCITALGQINQHGVTDWTFRIFGQGNRAWVEKLVQAHGLAGKVEIFDEIGDEALRRELSEADLAFMPSHVEAFGLSIAEAQAAGLPVIAYHVGSVPEIVQHGVTGWLAPFREMDELVRLLEQAIGHPEATRLAGHAGRERIRDLYSWDNTAAVILDALKSSP